MMDTPPHPAAGETYTGACTGPLGEECGAEHTRYFPIEKAPDAPYIRFRCPDCGSIAVLTKEQT